MKKRIALLLCTLLSAWANAQSTPASDSLTKLQDSLKEVTVTATRTYKDVMEVGRSVTVISSEQIKQANCNTVAELLSQQAGIFIDGTGQNPGVIQTLFLRGADNNHTTIMIDGVPISDPSNDHNELDLSELSLADVDRIEIVRGSHSILYGSSAMGGVINIITNKNATPGFHINVDETMGELGSSTPSSLSYGKYFMNLPLLGEENIALNYTFKNGLYIDAGYHRWDDAGLSAAVDTLKNPLPYQVNPINEFHKGDLFGKLGYHHSKLDAFFEYRNTDQTFGIPEGAFEPANNYNGHLTRNFYAGFFKYSITPDFDVQYTGGYSTMSRSYNQDTTLMYYYGNYKSLIADSYTGKSLSNDVQVTYNVKSSRFIVGGGSNYLTMNSSTHYWSGSVQDSTEYTSLVTLDSLKPYQIIYDAFAQADLNGATFSPGLKAISLLIGARLSSISTFGNNISYEINPSFRINQNSLLYCSYSTGFNAPSLFELHGPDDMQGDPISLANSTLTPETSASFEVGIKHRMANTYFTLSYYNTVVSNYIDYVYLWTKNKAVDSLTYSDFLGDTYLNIGKETTKGFELSMNSQLDARVSLSANISILSNSLDYSSSKIDTTHTHGSTVQIFNGGEFLTQNSGDVKINGLLRRPGALANVSIMYKPVKALSLTASARYVGARTDAQFNPALGPYGADASTTISDYTLLDLYASLKISKSLSVTLSCQNLFNTTYYEVLGYTTLGRSFYLNIRYSL